MRIKELDSLRGIAALLVVLYHYTTRYDEIFGGGFTVSNFDFKYGHYGVHLFFIISGFVIFMTIDKINNPFNFLYKRFLRLYPIYWISMLTTFFVVNYIGPEKLSRDWFELLINISMVSQLFGVKFIDGVYWSLIPELFFYGLVFFILQFNLKKKIYIIVFIWLLFSAIHVIYPIKHIGYLLNLEYGVFFISGIMFYFIYKKENSIKEHFIILLSSGVYFIGNLSYEIIIVLVIVYTLFYLFVFEKLNWIALPSLLFIGKISYPLYLVHQYIGYSVINILVNLNFTNQAILIITPLTVSIVLAWFLMEFLEKPLINIIKRVYTFN